MDILTNIRNLARERNIPLYKIEEDLGFGNNTIRKWNKHSPSVANVMKVAEYLDCSVDEILGIKKEPTDYSGPYRDIVIAFSALSEDQKKLIIDLIKGITQA